MPPHGWSIPMANEVLQRPDWRSLLIRACALALGGFLKETGEWLIGWAFRGDEEDDDAKD